MARKLRSRPEEIAAVEGLKERHGRIAAEDLVVEARDPQHVWHQEFTWDDSEAAKLHRLDTARRLLRSVVVTVENAGIVIPTTVPYVLRDPNAESGQQGYVTLTSLAKDRDSARRAMLHEMGQAAALVRRARQIGIALGFADEIDEVLAALLDLQSRVREAA